MRLEMHSMVYKFTDKDDNWFYRDYCLHTGLVIWYNQGMVPFYKNDPKLKELETGFLEIEETKKKPAYKLTGL